MAHEALQVMEKSSPHQALSSMGLCTKPSFLPYQGFTTVVVLLEAGSLS